MTTNTADLSALRATMIKKVQELGWAQRPEVERVLRDTPRHEFVPDATPDRAYDPYNAVITHRFSDGSSLSCASAPFVVAMMLDQLDVRPGNRVLEIGAGTGYNAALLAELTGAAGSVTTIDIDPDVTVQASRALATAGYYDVRVITGDGAAGVPEHEPYDRLIATVSPGTSRRRGGATRPRGARRRTAAVARTGPQRRVHLHRRAADLRLDRTVRVRVPRRPRRRRNPRADHGR